MPLNLQPNEGGEFTPYIKYNSKAGRWYAKPKEGPEAEVINPRLAFDFANIKTGWIMFTEGMGPVSVWDKGGENAVKPEGKYKRGFNVLVFGSDSIPGLGPLGLREFSSTANVVLTSIISMYNQYEAQMNQHPVQIPVFQCVGVTAITGMHGTNYEPNFQLQTWVDRNRVPAFDEALAKAVAPPPAALPAHMPPGVQQRREVLPAPDPNAPLASDFMQPSAFGQPGPTPQGGGGDLDSDIPFSPCIH